MVKDRFKKQFWISFTIIVASVAITVGALDFFSGNISMQADAIARDRAAIQAKTDSVSDLATLISAAPQAAQYEAAIDQIVPDQSRLVTFTQWFASLGTRYGVTANALFQGSAVPAAGATPGSAQFSFGAQGSVNNVATFLNAMNASSSGFFISLTSFDVTGDGTNENVTGQGMLIFR